MAGGVSGSWVAPARSFFAVPLRPQSYLNVLYVSLAFPLGLLYFLFVAIGFSVGIGLSLVLVGIPILLVTFAGALGLALFERWLTALLLDVDIDAGIEFEDEGAKDRAYALLTDPATWKAIVYLPVKLAFGVVSLVLLTTLLPTAIAMLFAPFHYRKPGLYVGFVPDRPIEIHRTLYLAWDRLLVGIETAFSFGWWEITTLPRAIAVAVGGILLLFVTLHAVNLLARLSGWFAAVMLDGIFRREEVDDRIEPPAAAQ